MEAFELLFQGFQVLMTWDKIALMRLGLVLGIFVGVLPGLGGPNGVAILLPLTFSMDPTSAIVMLSAIRGGSPFGGGITSILFNIPAVAFAGAPSHRPCSTPGVGLNPARSANRTVIGRRSPSPPRR